MLRLLRTALPRVAAPRGAVPLVVGAVRHAATEPKVYRQRLLDGNEEILTEEEKQEKDSIIKELTRKLSGPLADEDGNVPTGEDRPIAIEVDGPSHFYANSQQYTAYTKLKHRLLTRMGYKVLHVPYFEWRQLRSARDREDYMRAKLKEEPSEWLDPEDEKYYIYGPDEGAAMMSLRTCFFRFFMFLHVSSSFLSRSVGLFEAVGKTYLRV
ncbi:FAST kinase domain-containing protein 3 [Durusdinium trenchii]|uniref:Mitochondrial n=1 Tax=Durusdinium trenchii TaxID=1381693 RepID=A0ABP0STQ7_9DINO